MIDGDLYRALLVALQVIGLATGAVVLWLHRPTRWRSPTARDSSGWVLSVTLLFAWALSQVVIAWLHGVRPPDRPLWSSALPALGIGVLLVGDLLRRLRRYLAVLKAERDHPTLVCPICKGDGVIPTKEAGG